MNIIERIAAGIAFVRSAEGDGETPPQRPPMIAPPSRGTVGWNTADRALSLSNVYRAVQIHATAGVQLSIDVDRDGKRIPAPSLIRKPDVDTDRTAFIEYSLNCLWLCGEAFWRKVRADVTSKLPGTVVSLTPLNPNEVHVAEDARTRRPVYTWRNEPIAERDIVHLKMLRVPGHLRGLGPIQAARLEIEGAIDARDYGSSWFTEAHMPSGTLTTKDELTPDQIKQYKAVWNETTDHGIRVLGSGLSYSPLLLKPADVQFLESQQFNTTAIARLMGIPASLMLAAVEGQSRTYSNVLEEWRGYLQFTAMKPLREIETALSGVLPGQQNARFNLDAFLRLDTKSRYEAHASGIKAGWLLKSEVRAIEGLDPIDGIDDAAQTFPTEETEDARV